eukprot:CAMPEP_0171533568 /NCGR_PEP_ID=MMETSP0959-20130129/15751_1 /TAXON_ID=87120 /ORGANISM="Aurantiochytrium limacinum, Strain ATCCMYA-1381" /LENGTH=67 /DNA_ID=CAMNT_0012078577 /DNA_START=137 /DNA_END=340 /DNA_ORIENTATION=+
MTLKYSYDYQRCFEPAQHAWVDFPRQIEHDSLFHLVRQRLSLREAARATSVALLWDSEAYKAVQLAN